MTNTQAIDRLTELFSNPGDGVPTPAQVVGLIEQIRKTVDPGKRVETYWRGQLLKVRLVRDVESTSL